MWVALGVVSWVCVFVGWGMGGTLTVWWVVRRLILGCLVVVEDVV